MQVVQEYERAVIFRLGRLLSGGSRGPGAAIDGRYTGCSITRAGVGGTLPLTQVEILGMPGRFLLAS